MVPVCLEVGFGLETHKVIMVGSFSIIRGEVLVVATHKVDPVGDSTIL